MTTNFDDTVKGDIQGFITSGFKHIYHTIYLFLKIEDKAKAQEWLSTIVDEMTTAKGWRPVDDSANGAQQASKPPKERPQKIMNIAFTVEGLKILGLPPEVIETFPVQFQEGMADEHRALLLGDTHDNSPDNWEIGNPKDGEFHILLILNAGNNPDKTKDIDAFAKAQKDIATKSGLTVRFEELGSRRRDDKELFGFHDGIAQPKVEGVNVKDSQGDKINNAVKTGEFILGYQDAYGLFPASPVMDKKYDPNDILPPYKNPRDVDDSVVSDDLRDLGMHGSYIVYRKLVQDVAAFWKFVVQEVERIDGKDASPERVVWLASKFVGRTPHGDPLTPHPQSPHKTGQDDFLYATHDKEGLYCPVGSHLRRTNPRDVFHPENPESSIELVDKHRIIRRGRIFGSSAFELGKLDYPDDTLVDTIKKLKDKPKKTSGLHFLCVNADIQRQFEFIQHNWSNDPNFNELYENKDPIIGDNSDPDQPDSFMSIPTKKIRIRTDKLPRFVSVVGGAYLFMPSKTALKFLAQYDESS